ncbi:MAG: hypothetical protein CMJ69_19120 [Planctomycetaceae bacterium]|nr:hypothetical protein [Planctomycetaceae bacterium]
MTRRDTVWLAVVLVTAGGCSHLVETRSVNRFTGAFEDRDIAALREATTSGFQQKALRDKTAVDAMGLLELPEGKVKVAEVEEISTDRRRVKVEIGATSAAKKKLTFELSRDGKSGAWLVDDLLLKQSRRGTTVTRSATDLMDLLLSVHEFQRDWQSGDRKKLLGSTSEGFSKKLAEIPASYLAKLATRVAVSDGRTFSSQPRASLDKGTAQVRYNGPEGETVLALIQESKQWRVDDIVFSANSTSRQPESVRLLASVVSRATGFLDAFNRADRQSLQANASTSFYNNCLARADLNEVQLPGSTAIDGTTEVRLQKTFSDIVIKQSAGLVRLSLEREPASDPKDTSVRGFRVAEVTMVDFGTQQERRLSAVFTAHARMRLFLTAVRKNDLPALRHNSSSDFNNRVWKQVTPVLLPEILKLAFSDAEPDVLGTVFQGAVTEITVAQGTQALTCVLREQNGSLLVDDIHVPSEGLPGSLKQQFERLVPVLGFRQAIAAGDTSAVAGFSSSEFNRLVWSQVGDRLPARAAHVGRFLDPRVSRIHATDKDREEVLLGDRRFGARVMLVAESHRFRVDDIELLAGEPASGDRPTWLKQELRLDVARPQNRRPAAGATDAPKAAKKTPLSDAPFPGATPDVPAGPNGR